MEEGREQVVPCPSGWGPATSSCGVDVAGALVAVVGPCGWGPSVVGWRAAGINVLLDESLKILSTLSQVHSISKLAAAQAILVPIGAPSC